MDVYNKTKSTPHIEVIDISKNEETNETALHFEVNEAFLELVKKDTKTDEITQEQLSEYVTKLVSNCADFKNGYSYDKITELPDDYV